MITSSEVRSNPRPRAWTASWPCCRSGPPTPATVACQQETSSGEFHRLFFGKVGGIVLSLVNILGLQIRVGTQNRFLGFSTSEKPKQPCNRKTKAADAWLSGTDARVYGNAFEFHSLSPLVALPVWSPIDLWSIIYQIGFPVATRRWGARPLYPAWPATSCRPGRWRARRRLSRRWGW